jgi:hypothetical protein
MIIISGTNGEEICIYEVRMKDQKHVLATSTLQTVIELFDSIYEEFAGNPNSKLRLVPKEKEFPPADKIKTILKSEERKPMNVLKYTSRNPGYFPKLFKKNAYLTLQQTHIVIDVSCGLIFDILNQFFGKSKTIEQISIARDYLYIKLTIATCENILNFLKRDISQKTSTCHSHFFKICHANILFIRKALEDNKDLSEQFNTVIELLTNKLCRLTHPVRKNMFDVDFSNVQYTEGEE